SSLAPGRVPPLSPTRRSSDLIADIPPPLPCGDIDTQRLFLGQWQWQHAMANGNTEGQQRGDTGNRQNQPTTDDPAILDSLGLFRSEEHTSELQSRENLVCRLL